MVATVANVERHRYPVLMGRRAVPRTSVWRLVSNLLLLTLPLRLWCELAHNCMCGHLGHDPVLPGYAFDAVWGGVTLFAALRARAALMPLRNWVMGIVVLDVLTIAMGVRLPLVTLVPTAWVAVSVRRELAARSGPSVF